MEFTAHGVSLSGSSLTVSETGGPVIILLYFDGKIQLLDFYNFSRENSLVT